MLIILVLCLFLDEWMKEKAVQEFLEEATIMKDFEHENVLSLIGVVIKNNKPHVVLPLMQHGDLLNFVGNERNVLHVPFVLALVLSP